MEFESIDQDLGVDTHYIEKHTTNSHHGCSLTTARFLNLKNHYIYIIDFCL
jgi:hypothetical protein